LSTNTPTPLAKIFLKRKLQIHRDTRKKKIQRMEDGKRKNIKTEEGISIRIKITERHRAKENMTIEKEIE
jgi:hypothetical protein